MLEILKFDLDEEDRVVEVTSKSGTLSDDLMAITRCDVRVEEVDRYLVERDWSLVAINKSMHIVVYAMPDSELDELFHQVLELDNPKLDIIEQIYRLRRIDLQIQRLGQAAVEYLNERMLEGTPIDVRVMGMLP